MVDLKKLREDLILKGKHSPKFKVVLEKYAKGHDAKYMELDNIEESGAINQTDAEVLYDLVQKYKPKKIFEIGTWFGTSALVMAVAGAPPRAHDGHGRSFERGPVALSEQNSRRLRVIDQTAGKGSLTCRHDPDAGGPMMPPDG